MFYSKLNLIYFNKFRYQANCNIILINTKEKILNLHFKFKKNFSQNYKRLKIQHLLAKNIKNL